MNALIHFEDEHLLVINKPAGWNTHAPSPHAGEGVYDWLRYRESRWADLAIIHRLDKETSGILVFAKTRLANQSLTSQFTARSVAKKYLLLTDRPAPPKPGHISSCIVRAGDRYVSRPPHAGGESAETRFNPRESVNGRVLIEAHPITGRTHQIRVHAAECGFPILGDTLYGGSANARLCLHAAELTIQHPATGAEMRFAAPVDFDLDARTALRDAIIDPDLTNAFRLIHGEADGWPGWHLDRLGGFLLSQSEQPLNDRQRDAIADRLRALNLAGAYHKPLLRHIRKTQAPEACPESILGEPAPEEILIVENGVRFSLSFREGYSVGLFLDQRDNRRRLLTSHVAAGFALPGGHLKGTEVLNAFAYTCGFSVCAALAGARVTSLDLSKKYLDWGRRNFILNNVDPADHDFIFGDAFTWLRRLAKKGRKFDCVVLDPPTFSQSKDHGVFRAEKDFGALIAAAAPVLNPGGILFASTNAAALAPERFQEQAFHALRTAGRTVRLHHYVPQPPDFPITRSQPGHLKTLWMSVE